MASCLKFQLRLQLRSETGDLSACGETCLISQLKPQLRGVTGPLSACNKICLKSQLKLQLRSKTGILSACGLLPQISAEASAERSDRPYVCLW